MTRKQLISALLLAGMLATVSCGGGGGTGDGGDTTPGGGDDTNPPVADGYDYQGKRFDGYELTMLNLDVQYGCYIRLDFTEQTGEQLDEAIYARNRKVEDQLGITISEIILPRGSEWLTGQQAVCEAVMNQVMADDDDYEMAYLPTFYKREVLTGEYLLNLCDIPELNLYSEYWDRAMNEELTVKGRLLTASSPLSVMSMDLSWVLLFNERIFEDLNLDFPYQLVRDGEWTLDKMNEYVTAGANLNGDETFQFNVDGNATYGHGAHASVLTPMLFSAGVEQYTRDKDGNIELTYGGDRIFTALEKLEPMSTQLDGKLYLNSGGLDSGNGYLAMFNNDRALFFGGQLKSAMELRAMESTFGLLPFPKLDANQENYKTMVGGGSCLLTIPTTQDDPSRIGFILDALSYESYKSVRPVYNEVTVSQKGLRNDDSIEMLDYIWDNRAISLLQFYGIDGITSAVTTLVTEGNVGSAASTIESKKSEADQKLAEFLESIE